MKFDSPITIDSGASAPIFVNASPSSLCAGLNVEFLGGYRANQFALLSHTHVAANVIDGTFDPARLGSSFGPSDNRKVLMNNGTIGQWRQLTPAEISGISGVSVTMLGKATTGEIRDYIVAAPASHTHDASHVDRGLFSVARLGSGVSGTSYVLVGNSNLSAGGQWKQLTYADVGAAAPGHYAWVNAAIAGRLAYWNTDTLNNETLGASPVYLIPGFVGIAGGFGLAVDDNEFYINGVKLPKPPTDTKLYGLRANGSTNAAWEEFTTGLPALPSVDGVYVLVRSSGVFTWRELVGDGVGIN